MRTKGKKWPFAQDSPRSIIFTGTGKRKEELPLAAELGIHVVVESLKQLELLEGLRHGGNVALGLNLGLDVATHLGLFTSAAGVKFGLDAEEAAQALNPLRKTPKVRLIGLPTHLAHKFPRSHLVFPRFFTSKRGQKTSKTRVFPRGSSIWEAGSL